jgi:hypothetical protein
MLFCYTELSLPVSATIRELSRKKYIHFNFQLPSTLMFLFLFHKNGHDKSCSSIEDLSAHNISWFHIDWFKFPFISNVWTSAVLQWLKLRD